MNEEKKRERKVTPTGEAKWAHLDKPKKPFQDKGEAKYQIDVVFDPKDPAWNAWAKNLSETVKKVGKQSPIKKELDSNDEPTGRYYVTFKTSDKFKPNVFDRHGKNLLPETRIGNGSKVRVSYMENEFTAFGGGINLYLNAVQVIELVEYTSRSATDYGFDVEEGDAFPDEFDTSAGEPF